MKSHKVMEIISQFELGYMNPNDFAKVYDLIEVTEDFFKTERDSTQIAADMTSFYKLIFLSDRSIGIAKTSNGKIVGWCTVLPTTPELMQKFLKSEITEKEMFNRTKLGDQGSLYIMLIFILLEYRKKNIPENLIINTIKPFLKQDLKIFYRGSTKEGVRFGKLLKKRYEVNLYDIEFYAL